MFINKGEEILRQQSKVQEAIEKSNKLLETAVGLVSTSSKAANSILKVLWVFFSFVRFLFFSFVFFLFFFYVFFSIFQFILIY